MIKVFIGGSRKISKLNKKTTLTLDRILEKGMMVLVGDANGADKAVQKYLMNKNYNNVTIHCMKNGCRNNLGNWQVRYIDTISKNNGFMFYSLKDLIMAKETDYGFMLWDSKSKGTLNNILNLLKERKQVVVYFSPTKSLYKINTYHDLLRLLRKCDPYSLDKFEKEFKLSRLIYQPRLLTIEK